MTGIFGDSLWSILVVVGPLILVAALAYAMLRNKTTARQDVRTEEATRDNYREEARKERDQSL